MHRCSRPALHFGGLYGFWLWRQAGRAWPWAVAAAAGLLLGAWLLTRAQLHVAGRGFLVYIGLFALLAVLLLRFIEGAALSRCDLVGLVLLLAGAALVGLGPLLAR
ncbi:MAG: YnfA family protein [Solimonas sp.]